MPGLETHIASITQAIQLAIAPVFLLTAIAGLINALLGRFARAIDRRRTVEELLEARPALREALLTELALLRKRTLYAIWAIGLCVLSALMVCLVIFAAFLGAFLGVDLSRTVAILFIAAVASLTIAMLVFMREVMLAALSVHQSVWPDPARVERSQATAAPK